MISEQERICRLEAELAQERAKVHELSSALACAVSASARAQQVDAERRAVRSAQNRRSYERRQQSIQHAESGTESPPSPPPLPSSFPPSPEPSSPYPLSFPPSSPAPVSAGTFALEPTGKQPRRPRKESPQEALYRKLQDAREARCVEVGEPFIADGWSAQKQNTQLKALLEAPSEAQDLFVRAWCLYLADDGERARTPAWSLGWFMAGGVRAKYETMAAREEAA